MDSFYDFLADMGRKERALARKFVKTDCVECLQHQHACVVIGLIMTEYKQQHQGADDL